MMMRLVAKSANESMNMQTRPTHLSHPFNPLPIPDSLFLRLSKEESHKHASIELTSLPLSLCSTHPSSMRPSVSASLVPHPLASQAIVSSSFPFRSCFLPSLSRSFFLCFPLSFLFLVAVKQIRSKRDCLCGTITKERARAASGND